VKNSPAGEKAANWQKRCRLEKTRRPNGEKLPMGKTVKRRKTRQLAKKLPTGKTVDPQRQKKLPTGKNC
jgi:hypothetical protein